MNRSNENKGVIKMGLFEVWTLIAVVLHFCEVSVFGEWPVIAWPWHWSCFCLLIWEWVIVAVLFAVYKLLEKKARKHLFECNIKKLRDAGFEHEANLLLKEKERSEK